MNDSRVASPSSRAGLTMAHALRRGEYREIRARANDASPLGPNNTASYYLIGPVSFQRVLMVTNLVARRQSLRRRGTEFFWAARCDAGSRSPPITLGRQKPSFLRVRSRSRSRAREPTRYGAAGRRLQLRLSPSWVEICCAFQLFSDISQMPGLLLRLEKKASSRPSGLQAG